MCTAVAFVLYITGFVSAWIEQNDMFTHVTVVDRLAQAAVASVWPLVIVINVFRRCRR